MKLVRTIEKDVETLVESVFTDPAFQGRSYEIMSLYSSSDHLIFYSPICQ